jgi:hypothetical protein
LLVGNFNPTALPTSTFTAKNTAGDVQTYSSITASAKANLFGGTSVTIPTGDTITGGTGLNITTPTANITGNGVASTNDIVVENPGAGTLTVNLAGDLTASKGNVDFNGTALVNAGSVLVTGTGSIAADGTTGTNGLVNLNIGTGTANVTANTILGGVQDPNYLTTASDTVTVTAAQDAAGGKPLQIGNFNASANAASTFTATNTAGDVVTFGNITASATANLNGGTSVSIETGNTVTGGTGLNITSPTVNVNGTGIASTNDVLIENPGAGTLTVNMTAGNLTASKGNVDFNGTALANAGSVLVTGTGNIAADGTTGTNGLVNLNIGTGTANVTANTLLGYVGDPNYATTASDSVSVTTAQDSLGNQPLLVGNFNPTALPTSTFTAKNTAGDVQTYSSITASAKANLFGGTSVTIPTGDTITGGTGLNITTPTANITGNGVASTNDIVVENPGAGTLTVNLAGDLTASKGNVDFNGTALVNAGSVLVTGTGNIAADGTTGTNGLVNLNIGTGTANVTANTILGGVQDPNYLTTASDTVTVTAAKDAAGGKPLQVGNFNASANAASTFTATNTAGDFATFGSITAAATANFNGGTSVSIEAGNTVTGGTGLNITSPTVNVNGTGIASTNDVVIENPGAGTLTVHMTAGNLTASKGNVDFNGTALANAGSVLVTGTGNIAADGTTGANGLVNLNIGTGTANVTANTILGGAQDPNYLTTASDTVTVTAAQDAAGGKPLQVGNFNASANAASTFTATNTAGDFATFGNITAAATANFNGGTSVSIEAGNTVTGGTGLNITSPTVNVNGTGIASTNDVVIENPGAGALTVNMTAGNLTASKGNVDFNGTALANARSLLVTGSGDIYADGTSGTNGLVNLNIGAGTANVTANEILGYVQDPNFLTAPSNSVSVTVAQNALGTQPLLVGNFNPTASPTASFSAKNTAGDLVTYTSITASATANLYGGTSVTIPIGKTITGGRGLNVTTPNANIYGDGVATTGNIDVQNTNAGTLDVNLTGDLTASAGNAAFNGTSANTAGAITIIGSGNIVANGISGSSGLVNLNLGHGAGDVNVNSILGCVEDPNYSLLASDSVSITTAQNAGGQPLMVGNFNAQDNATSTFSVLNATGDILTCGNIYTAATATLTAPNSVTIGSGNTIIGGGGVSILTPALSVNGFVTAATGNIDIQNTGTLGSVLNVSMGPSVSGARTVLSANDGSVSFNPTQSSQINITGGAQGLQGYIHASKAVVLNAGSAPIYANVDQIAGCIEPTGAPITIETHAGSLDFCLPINTSSGTGAGGAVTIIADGGPIEANSITTNGTGSGNAAGSVTLVANGGGINVGAISANGNGGANAGTISLTAPRQQIYSGALTADSSSGNAGTITTNSAKILVSGSINANGTATSGGTINITTTGGNFLVIGNGYEGNGIEGSIHADGGVSGGSITLSNNPGQIVAPQSMVTANGSINGGTILFQTATAFKFFYPLRSEIFGSVMAVNDSRSSGRIGFNHGPYGDMIILGNGNLVAGDGVRFGNLNPINLDTASPRGGYIYLDKSLSIQYPIINGIYVPVPQSPTTLIGTASGPSGFGAQTQLANVASLTEASESTANEPNGGAVLASFQALPATEENAVLSLTPTDVTQIFSFADLDQSGDNGADQGYHKQMSAYVYGSKIFAHEFSSQEISRLKAEGTFVAASADSSNTINLAKGNVLFAPDRGIVVATKNATIQIGPRAVVFVIADGDNLVIYNLYQPKGNSVSVITGKDALQARAGQMLVLTPQKAERFENLHINCQAIAYRNVIKIAIQNGANAYLSEFSVPSAFTQAIPLKQMLSSGDAHEKAIVDKILTSSLMMNELTANAGPFVNGEMNR